MTGSSGSALQILSGSAVNAVIRADPMSADMTYRQMLVHQHDRQKQTARVAMIALLAAEAIGPAVLEKMRRIRSSLDTGDNDDPPFPLGD